MNCLEFKKMVLSEPHSKSQSFLEHSKACPDCLEYLTSVRQMDSDLASSLNADVPSDLIARLQLNQEMMDESELNISILKTKMFTWWSSHAVRKTAIAASVCLGLFVAGFMASNQLAHHSIGNDYESLLTAVTDHMHEQAITPVWDSSKANQAANALLASYDGEMQLKYLSNLQFSKICPMGKYKGLHASLETPNGQVTFAYIKGESVGELFEAGFKGYVSQVKPVRGGNLIIMSHTSKAVQQAASQLEEAMYWDI